MMMSRDKIEDKLEELIAASRLNELLNKKEAEEEKKKSNCVIAVLAVIGAVAAVARLLMRFTDISHRIIWKTLTMMILKTTILRKMTSRMKTNPIVSEKVYKDATGWSISQWYFLRKFMIMAEQENKKKARARYS